MSEEIKCADQDAWEEFSLALRGEIAKRIKTAHSLSIGDLHSLICCVRDAYWCEIHGKSYQTKLDRAQSLFGDTSP